MAIQDGFNIVTTQDKVNEVKNHLLAQTLLLPKQSEKVLATTANGNTTLFEYTGTIRILAIVGRVNTVMETKTQNTKLAIVSDALSAVDICGNVDLTAAAVGTMLTITGTAANAMVASANGALAPGQAGNVIATCTQKGIIRQVAGAANTGAITWSVLWEPVSPGATLIAV
jgi:hypothetical protein